MGSTSAAGGSLTVIYGENIGAATGPGSTVMIGGNTMNVSMQTPTVIIGFLPPGSVGPTTILITSPTGCSGTFPFTYTQ